MTHHPSTRPLGGPWCRAAVHGPSRWLLSSCSATGGRETYDAVGTAWTDERTRVVASRLETSVLVQAPHLVRWVQPRAAHLGVDPTDLCSCTSPAMSTASACSTTQDGTAHGGCAAVLAAVLAPRRGGASRPPGYGSGQGRKISGCYSVGFDRGAGQAGGDDRSLAPQSLQSQVVF